MERPSSWDVESKINSYHKPVKPEIIRIYNSLSDRQYTEFLSKLPWIISINYNYQND